MTKRIITVIFAAVATLGLAAGPAQAADLGSGSKLVQPLGWSWGT